MHPPKYSYPSTLNELRAIDAELLAAIDEFIAMLETRGTLRTIWNEPRRYFVPEPETGIPFPCAHLCDLMNWCCRHSHDFPEQEPPNEQDLLINEIYFKSQYIDFLRIEFLPEKLIN